MIGLLTYLPTTAYLPQFMFLLAFVYLLIRDRDFWLAKLTEFKNNPRHPLDLNFMVLCVIILLSLTNRIYHWSSVKEMSDIFPYFLLIIPSYMLAIRLRLSDVKWLVALISVESVSVILQWVVGVSTFDSSLEGFTTFKEGSLAYFQRPFGFSTGSSIVASKFFLAYLLIDFFQLKRGWNYPLKTILILGIAFTFNRTVILSMGVYMLLSSVQSFFAFRYTLEKAWFAFWVGLLGGISSLTLLLVKAPVLIAQFTRNTGNVELTGREHIWKDFIVFIYTHLAYGNYSIKLWLDGYHAHNSYLELIATNGVFISLVYFIFIYRNIKRSNWIYVFPILIFGLTQYAFFWGVSLFDIVFMAILTRQLRKVEISPSPVDEVPKETITKGLPLETK